VNALAEFKALNIAFVSLSDNLGLSTTSGRLMFQIVGAMAEFERELIRERVKTGMKNAGAKGIRIGRPRRANIDADQIAWLRAQGLNWKKIAKQMGIGVEHPTASPRRRSLLANHLEVGGRNRHRATFFGHVAGEFYLVAQVGHKFCVVVRREITRNGVNLAVRGQQRNGLAHLGASCRAVRFVSTRHLMIDPSI
jgi:Resolvase, N terminal domain